jgi:MFS family permease
MRVLLPACLVLAAASLAVPVAPGYDAWSWLVWGRELARLDLDTTGGPSWKPLPVLVTSILSPFGDAAPTLWLLVIRTTTFLSLGLAARLALRLAGPLAAAVAPILVPLTPNPEARFLRYAAQGFAEPLIVALLLGGIERHLDGRRDHALVLGVLAALLRPEVWPFLGLYGLWLWRAEPRRRRLAIGLLPLVPILWLGGDWLGSGGVLTGADRARDAGDEAPAMQLAQAHAEVFEVVTAPVWVAAVVTMLAGLRRREPFVVPVLGALALAWLALLFVMTAALGFYSGGRFAVPAGALLSILAAVGVVRVVDAAGGLARRLVGPGYAVEASGVGGSVPLRRHPARIAPAAARVGAVLGLAALTMPFAAGRLASVPAQASAWSERAVADAEVRKLAQSPGVAKALAACGPIAVDWYYLARDAPVAVAWELELPLDHVQRRLRGGRGHVFALREGKRFQRLSRRAMSESRRGAGARDAGSVELVASSPRWGLFAVGCER